LPPVYGRRVAVGQAGKAGAAHPRTGEREEERGVGLGQQIGLGREGRRRPGYQMKSLFFFIFKFRFFQQFKFQFLK
jgi:hypothetical protein